MGIYNGKILRKKHVFNQEKKKENTIFTKKKKVDKISIKNKKKVLRPYLFSFLKTKLSVDKLRLSTPLKTIYVDGYYVEKYFERRT